MVGLLGMHVLLGTRIQISLRVAKLTRLIIALKANPTIAFVVIFAFSGAFELPVDVCFEFIGVVYPQICPQLLGFLRWSIEDLLVFKKSSVSLFLS